MRARALLLALLIPAKGLRVPRASRSPWRPGLSPSAMRRDARTRCEATKVLDAESLLDDATTELKVRAEVEALESTRPAAPPASSAERRWNEQEGRLTPKREGERLKSFLFEDDQAEDVRMLSEAIRERTGFSILNQDKSDLSSDFKLICVFCFMFTTLGLTTLSVQFGHGFAGAVSLMSEQS